MDENKEYIESLRRKYSSDTIDSYDNTEILELVMSYAQPRSDALAVAEELEKSFNSFFSICETPIDILEEKGISHSGAVLLKLIPDVCRIYNDKSHDGQQVEDSKLMDIMASKFIGTTTERSVLMLIDKKGKELFCDVINKGGIKGVDIGIPRIVSLACEKKASKAVLAHNHPSGNPLPSEADLQCTQKLYSALNLVGITLIDHIIVADEECLSFRDTGLLDEVISDTLI